MKKVDCYWELENLGRKVVEIRFDSYQEVNPEIIRDVENVADYVVVKTPVGSISSSLTLTQLGYVFAEMQICIEKNIQELRDELTPFGERFYNDSRLELVTDEADLESIIESMTPGMFVTDRVYLDPQLGPSLGFKRYVNWMRTAFHSGSTLHRYIWRNKCVGFSLVKESNGTIDGLLGGAFEKYQAGMGMLLPIVPLFYADMGHTFIGRVSSNNQPVIKVFDQFGYHYKNMEYVYVKHIHR